MSFRVYSSLSVLFLVLVTVECMYVPYNTAGRTVPGKLNVHLVPHTHDDVGWKKTIDQYYVGSNNSIHEGCVQNVLDSLIPALLADKNRKFIFAEQAFFQMWWRRQSDSMQSTVKKLVSSGQLEFINGGMCMHDEAATHYIDMIDQTTLGHRYIKQQFNVTPRAGWQIDPFGHSAVQAYLLTAEVGFDSLFFARIDYQDLAKRLGDKTLEVIWQGSNSRGSSSQIFTGAFYTGFYEPPKGFYFEINDDSNVIQDDMSLYDYNVQERINDFVQAALIQANVTRTNHIMFTMGTDFKYQYAESWFRNMDKLIHYANQDGRINALYSTPSLYADAKHASNVSWPLKTDDYFPYADRENASWTGYYTSRPALKGYVRMLSSYYLAARQLEFFKGRNKAKPTTDSLAEALAIVQHHDGITGTEKQHVADDYAKRLSIGYTESEEVIAASLGSLTQSVTNFTQCPLLNISYCPPTEVNLSHGKKLVVIVYNSLGRKRRDVVRFPVLSDSVTVKDSAGKLILSQIVPLVNASLAMRNTYARAYTGKSPTASHKYLLAFAAEVPPLGFSTYVISASKPAASGLVKETSYKFGAGQPAAIEIGQGNLKLIYSARDAKLVKYVNTKSSVNISVEQSYSYYISSDGLSEDTLQPQASGAYIFRPNSTSPVQMIREKTELRVFKGPLFDEVHQKINSSIYQITRVYKEKEHAEVEFMVGPIPTDDGIGKEIVTQIKSTIENNKTFYTDSNGRDYLERIRDYRADWKLQVNQPVAGNYYPINHGIYIKDKSTELSVLVDRAVGGSSIKDGQLEIMLHRRLITDDGRGVEDPLDEQVCVLDQDCSGLAVQGKFYLRFDRVGQGSKWRRSFGQEVYSPFLLAFAEEDEKWANFPKPTFSAMDPSYSLPDNVAIITLQELEDGTVLLRLAHLFEVDEDKDLSVMATVELKRVFADKKIKKIKEMSLSANQEREEMEKKRLSWKVEAAGSSKGKQGTARGGPVNPAKLVVQLAPMEIRTFLIVFTKESKRRKGLYLFD